MGTKKVSLKLLVDTEANKVLFAEASKDFVDFLFHILSLPIGTTVKLLTEKGMVGSLGNLYSSVKTLDTDYLQPNFDAQSLLQPCATAVSVPLLSSFMDDPDGDYYVADDKFYVCYEGCDKNVSDAPGAVCSNCRTTMSSELTYVAPKACASKEDGKSGGYVKGMVTYMVMDDLEVKPMSTISGITILNRFNVKDVCALVEKQVQVGLDEGIAIVKASLETRSVLTTAFLGNKKLV